MKDALHSYSLFVGALTLGAVWWACLKPETDDDDFDIDPPYTENEILRNKVIAAVLLGPALGGMIGLLVRQFV